MMNREFATINGNNVDVTTVFDKTVEYIPSMEESEMAVQKGEELLNKYFDCLKDNEGLWEMFRKDGRFWKAKGWLISAMKNHKDYNGNYQIVLHNQDMCRHINLQDIDGFFEYMREWINKNRYVIIDSTGEVISQAELDERINKLEKDYNRMFDKYRKYGHYAYRKFRHKISDEISKLYDYSLEGKYRFAIEVISILDSYIYSTHNHLIDEDTEMKIKNIAVNYLPDFHACQNGQKISKLMQKVGKLIGITNHVDVQDVSFFRQDGTFVQRQKDFGWNYQFAKFADAINPITMKGTAVISVNYIDFWTMSFGKEWASCHTIDKENRRGNDHNYSGCYCGGTESYMLDDCSVIFYFLPNDFNGDNPEYEDKVKRCVFYLGEDKLIQSRVYPDGRDGGDKSLAGDVRTIMQKVVSELWDVPNYWTNSKGTSACSEVTSSVGPHYRDYLHYNDCNVSYMKRIDGYKNVKRIRIGSKIICPSCGKIHETENNIFCERCLDQYTCANCDEVISGDEAIWVNGETYCRDCVAYCEGCEEYEVEREMTNTTDGCRCRNCINYNYTWSDYECNYINDDDLTITEEGRYCYEDGYLICEECGEIHNDNLMHYDGETGNYYCNDCYEDLLRERESENETSEE